MLSHWSKYRSLFCCLLLVGVFCSNCGFPYNTRQAREARKANRIAKKEARLNPPLDTAQSSKLTAVDSLFVVLDSANVDSIQTVDTTASKISVVADSTANKKSIKKGKGSIAKIATDRIPTDSTNKKIIKKGKADIFAKMDTIRTDSLPPISSIDSLLSDSTKIVLNDSLEMTPDSLILPKRKLIRFSKDSMTLPVQYESADSMIYDIIDRKVYMYNNAEVYYEQYELKAGYIEFDFRTNVAMATCLIDSVGEEVQCPVFDDKQQKFESRRIEFNFKTKKGKVYDASTQQGDGYLVSDATKFISKEGDSSAVQDIIYSQGCLYTTCDHKHPHFGIRASRAKIIPNKLIVVGPSFLEIMGSPTPIVLPFGFFPLTKNKRSGLILSPDLDFSPTLGPGLKGNGFYLGLSEFWDLKVTGDFYLRGSLRAYINSNYNIRYKGNGSVNIGYTRLQIDELGTPDYSLTQSFNFSWTHNQSPQAHPSQTFNASLNFGTSDYYANTFNDAASVLQATINSRVSYSKRFLGTPFSITANMTHSQVTRTRAMTINLPVLTVNMNQIFPFKRKKAVGRPKWYERIGFSYNMTAKNTIVTTDTAFFTSDGFREALDNMQYDISHRPQISMSFKLFKFINIRPRITYSQNWYFYRNKQYLDPTPDTSDTGDTTAYGTVKTYKDYGFYTTHDFSAGISLNTQIYATGTFNILGLHQVRGVFTPDIGFSWKPDYESSFEYYYDSVQYDSRYPDQLRRYNHFGYAPAAGRTALLTYGINARFDAKVKRGRRDTMNKEPYKKIILIPNVSLNGNYNLAADSLHFSTLNFNTYTTLFKKINVRFTAIFDPYAADPETNRRINKFEFAVNQRLLRMTQMSFNVSTTLTAADFREWFGKKNKAKPKEGEKEKPKFELIQNIAINYNLVVQNQYMDGVDTALVVAHQLSFSGTINLSKGWNIRVGRIGYDFKNKRITYPDFTFSRDLHCWSMGLSWQPERRTWSFFLKVKPGSLSFFNVPVRKEFFDRF